MGRSPHNSQDNAIEKQVFIFVACDLTKTRKLESGLRLATSF